MIVILTALFRRRPPLFFVGHSWASQTGSARVATPHGLFLLLLAFNSFPVWHTGPVKRMTTEELDEAAGRLEEIGLEEEKLRSTLQEQVEEFGFTPPHAEKSKRLTATLHQFTVSRGLITEIKDAEVERIRQNCPGILFDRLFRTVTKFKLANGATQVLASRLPVDTPPQLAADVQPGS
jgi:hypothetical protein